MSWCCSISAPLRGGRGPASSMKPAGSPYASGVTRVSRMPEIRATAREIAEAELFPSPR